MKRIRTVLATIAVATLAFLPTNAFAAKGISAITSVSNSGTAINIIGIAEDETIAVAISVYNEDGSTLIGSPESASVNMSDHSFNYNVTGTFDVTKSYKVCAADFDGGAQVCQNTQKTVSPTEDEVATNPDTGIAPTADSAKDAAVKNVSLNIAVVVAASLVYGLYLIIKRKSARK